MHTSVCAVWCIGAFMCNFDCNVRLCAVVRTEDCICRAWSGAACSVSYALSDNNTCIFAQIHGWKKAYRRERMSERTWRAATEPTPTTMSEKDRERVSEKCMQTARTHSHSHTHTPAAMHSLASPTPKYNEYMPTTGFTRAGLPHTQTYSHDLIFDVESGQNIYASVLQPNANALPSLFVRSATLSWVPLWSAEDRATGNGSNFDRLEQPMNAVAFAAL